MILKSCRGRNRTYIPDSRGLCPTVRRPGNNRLKFLTNAYFKRQCWNWCPSKLCLNFNKSS